MSTFTIVVRNQEIPCLSLGSAQSISSGFVVLQRQAHFQVSISTPFYFKRISTDKREFYKHLEPTIWYKAKDFTINAEGQIHITSYTRHGAELHPNRNRILIAQILAAIIGGIFVIGGAIITVKYTSTSQATSIAEIPNDLKPIIAPSLTIIAPKNGQVVPFQLESVEVSISGTVPKDAYVLIGHREHAENTVQIHADRWMKAVGKSISLGPVYLGNEQQGAGAKFYLYGLLIDSTTFQRLDLNQNGDNPLKQLPNAISTAQISVKRQPMRVDLSTSSN